MERCNRTFREALDGEELTDLTQAREVMSKIIDWYNQERLHRALGYLKPIDYYRGNTDDGVLAIDNNLAERAMKIPAIGRKNWLFVASKTGGDRAVILFSLIASCKANQVEPFAYLKSLFQTLAERRTAATDRLEDLLPDRWLTENPEHRWQIDELRAEERKRSRQQRIAKRRAKR